MRRVVPDDVAGRVRVKVVYTVLEAQYQSALSAAVKAINAKNKTVCFEIVGYLLEELRDPTNFETFKEDLANANVFIGSLIFIEELAEKVRAGSAAAAAAVAVAAAAGLFACWTDSKRQRRLGARVLWVVQCAAIRRPPPCRTLSDLTLPPSSHPPTADRGRRRARA